MTAPMPAAFLGHGSPMNALGSNRFTQAWRDFGSHVPKPRAILVVSAHWFINVAAVTAMARPRTIHDFYGFPRKLFEVEYPAPGDETVAGEIAEIAKPTSVGLDRDSWGLDHGPGRSSFTPFRRRIFPSCSSRSMHGKGQHSISNSARDSRPCAPGAFSSSAAATWFTTCTRAHRLDDAARAILTGRPANAVSLATHRDFVQSAPTPEHFLPLLYVAGLAAAVQRPTQVLVDGYTYGSLSMTSYTLDVDCPRDHKPG
jgi:4,5-DOPA dioxygenase extradiol